MIDPVRKGAVLWWTVEIASSMLYALCKTDEAMSPWNCLLKSSS